ncbi:MAG: hypothetical protein K6F28_07255, partial [Lachnospiraceae bacterium]|nr:hypothetical protein [Lachnospiraceae bacterium]
DNSHSYYVNSNPDRSSDNTMDNNLDRSLDNTTDNNLDCKADTTKKEKNQNNEINKNTSEFDTFWTNYPRKAHKAQALDAYLSCVANGYSEKQLLEACMNYADECKNSQREIKYVLNANNFLNNNRFIEYFNDSYTPTKNNCCKKSPFHNFNEREYDYNKLQAELISSTNK